MSESQKPSETPFDEAIDEDVHIQIDAYGIKGRIKRGYQTEPEAPKTWREVWERVKSDLRNICVNIPGVVSDLLATVRAVLTGIGGIARNSAELPTAIARRIGQAHAIVRSIEDQQQQNRLIAQSTPESLLTVDEDETPGQRRLRDKLTELQSRGYNADLLEQDDGTWLIVILPPDYDAK